MLADLRKFLALLAALWPALNCPVAHAQDIVYVIRPGDTLIGIAAQWLADPFEWRQLAKPNRIANPNRIFPGREVRIPLAILKSETESATVIDIRGVAESANRGFAEGDSVGAGAEVRTGADGYMSLQLADGSRLTIPARSALRVEQLKRYSNTELRESRLRIIAGRIEAVVQKLRGAGARFEVNSPSAVISVRGTNFRSGVGESGKGLRVEVLEGEVAIGSASVGAQSGVLVNAGFGAVADDSGKISAPVALLSAPDLTRLPNLQERTLVRFRLVPMGGALAYRAQLARDGAFRDILREDVFVEAELRFADLPDGDYFLRLRGIDSLGLEGHDAQHAFRLKARPEPPFAIAPVNKSKLRATGAEFSWAAASEAASYHFQLARDERFAQLVHEVRTPGAITSAVRDLAPGEYFWRVASIRTDGDHGPFGDAQRLNLLPPPANPDPPSVEGNNLVFGWSSEPGQTFEFQVARDAKFADTLVNLKLTEPKLSIDRPPPGKYYFRLRAIDPDGFAGPYTATQSLELPATQSLELPNCLMSSLTGQCVSSSTPTQIWMVQ